MVRMRRATQLVTVFGGQQHSAEAAAYFAAMTNQLAVADKAAITAFIEGLKSDNIWTKIEIGYILALDDAQQSKLNFRNPDVFALADVGGGATHESRRGLTGNGSSTKQNTQWNPNDDRTVCSQDDISLWCWSRTDAQEAATGAGSTASPGLSMLTRNTSDQAVARCNDANTVGRNNAASIGLFGVSRSAPGTKKYWKNGLQISTDISTSTTGLCATDLHVCGASPSSFSTKQNAFWMVATGLAGLESALYDRVNTLLTNFGAA